MGIENTQVFTYTASASGPTGYQYFQLGTTLQTAGSAFVVKYLSVSSTTGITNSPDFAVQVTSNSSSGGAGTKYVLSSDASPVASNIPIILLNNLSQELVGGVGNQVILTQNYIGINVNMIAAGTFSVTISYSLIPAANALISNFADYQNSGVGEIPLFEAFVTGKTNILKSALVSNFQTSGISTVTFILKTGGTTSSYLSSAFTVNPGEFCCYSLPLYFPSGSSLALYANIQIVSGSADLNGYISYTAES